MKIHSEEQKTINNSVVFYGAGVSLNSGIPIVYSIFNDQKECLIEGLIDCILDKICNKSEKEKIKDANLPFEAFIETLMLASEVDSLYDIFDLGVPNHFHYAMAHFAKSKHITDFITTNFDRHLENALDQLGFMEGKDYIIITYPFNELYFSNISQKKMIRIIKLHGDIRNKDDLGITLRRVSSKDNKTAIKKVFEHFFSREENNKLEVLGYSCSDIFDISPALQEISEHGIPNININFIQHTIGIDCNHSKTEDIKSHQFKNPFSNNYKGSRVFVDTDEYLSHLCKTHNIEFKKTVSSKSYWQKYVNNWANFNADLYKLCLGNIFARIEDYTSAIKYLSEFVSEFHREQRISARAYIHLANAYAILHDFNNSLENASKALEYASHTSDVEISAHAYGAIGVSHVHMSNYLAAKKALEMSLNLSKNLNNFGKNDFDDHKALLLANLSTCYLHLNESKQFQSTIEQSISSANKLGDNTAKLICLRNLSENSSRLGEYDASLSILNEALILAKSIGHHHIVASVCLDLGNINKKIGNITDAKYYQGEALNFFKNSDNLVGVGIASGNLAMLYHQDGNLAKAEQLFDNAIVMSDELNKSFFLTAYGILLYDLECFDECIKKHQEAIKIASLISSNLAKYNALNSLGQIYLGLDKNEQAKSIIHSALQIAYDNNNELHIAQSSRWMALALWCLYEDSESIECAEKALTLNMKIFGRNHPKTIEAQKTLDKVSGL